jgi:glycosyltransferase involved in cell wall biosynthesis
MKICIVTSDIMGPIRNGGVGTSFFHLAKTAVKKKHSVDILFCSLQTDEDHNFHSWQCEYKAQGMNLYSLKNADFQVDQGHINAALSYLVFNHLRDQKYDLVIFPEMHGLGYYSLSAKKCGTFFQNTQLWVMFHGPSEWHLLHNRGLPTRLENLSTFFMEKCSTLWADRVLFATRHSKSIAETFGYLLPSSQSETVLFPYLAEPIAKATARKTTETREICFFGRLESRKGIESFLKALLLEKETLFQKNITVSLMGNEGWINSQPARQYLEAWILKNHFPLKLIMGKNHLQAIEYLKENGALVVIPSLAETMGYTLIECIVNQIPFVCSDIEPFQEVLAAYGKGSKEVRFKAGDEKSLARKLIQTLQKTPRFQPNPRTTQNILQAWEAVFEQAEADLKNKPEAKRLRPLSVSVCIPHRNRKSYLQELLESIVSAKSSIKEILIYDDASKDADSLRFLRSLSKQNKAIRVIFGQKQKGPGHARNVLAQNASSDYLLFIDDDNMLDARAFDRIRPVLNGETDIVVSPLIKFEDAAEDEEVALGLPRKTKHWCPIGDALTMNILQNLVGDANLIVRREFYQAIGGYSESLRWGEDHEFLLRAILGKARYLLSPDPFIYYRLHPTNSSRNAEIESLYRKMLDELVKTCGFTHEVTNLVSLFRSWAHRLDHLAGDPAPSSIKPRPLINPDRKDLHLYLKNARKVDFGRLSRVFSNPMVDHQGFVQIQMDKRVRSVSTSGPAQDLSIMILSPREGSICINGSVELDIKKGLSRIKIRKPKNSKLTLASPDGLQSVYVLGIEG